MSMVDLASGAVHAALGHRARRAEAGVDRALRLRRGGRRVNADLWALVDLRAARVQPVRILLGSAGAPRRPMRQPAPRHRRAGRRWPAGGARGGPADLPVRRGHDGAGRQLLQLPAHAAGHWPAGSGAARGGAGPLPGAGALRRRRRAPPGGRVAAGPRLSAATAWRWRSRGRAGAARHRSPSSRRGWSKTAGGRRAPPHRGGAESSKHRTALASRWRACRPDAAAVRQAQGPAALAPAALVH